MNQNLQIANLIHVTHMFVIGVYFMSILLLFTELNYYAALIIFILYVQYKILGNCVMTQWEDNYRKKAGEKVSDRHFVVRFIKRAIGIRVGRKYLFFSQIFQEAVLVTAVITFLI